MSDFEKRKREREQMFDSETQQESVKLNMRAGSGPYSHLMYRWVVFVDDYSHYRGKLIAEFPTYDGSIFHLQPCYQVSQFKEKGPDKSTRIDVNGPAVLRSGRFKVVAHQPVAWPNE